MRKYKEKFFKELSWIPKYMATTVFNLEKMTFSTEDLEQELSLTLWKAIEKYYEMISIGKKPKASIKRYCWVACKNSKGNFIRKINRNKRNVGKDSLTEHDIFIKHGFESEFKIDMSKKYKIIIDEIDILNFEYPNIYKAIFKDLIIGYSYQEVSEKYKINIGTIKVSIFKLRKKIKKKYYTIFENFFEDKALYIYRKQECSEEGNENKTLNKIDKKIMFIEKKNYITKEEKDNREEFEKYHIFINGVEPESKDLINE